MIKLLKVVDNRHRDYMDKINELVDVVNKLSELRANDIAEIYQNFAKLEQQDKEPVDKEWELMKNCSELFAQNVQLKDVIRECYELAKQEYLVRGHTDSYKQDYIIYKKIVEKLERYIK